MVLKFHFTRVIGGHTTFIFIKVEFDFEMVCEFVLVKSRFMKSPVYEVIV